MLRTPIGRLRILAFTEGISFLLILGITMPLKYILQMPEPNKIIGLLHGVLFVLYNVLVFRMAMEQRWKLRIILLAIAASIIPFGTFWADKAIFRTIEE